MKSFNFVPNDIIQIVETFPDDSISINFSVKNKPPLSLQKFGDISYSISEKNEQNLSIYANNLQEINHTKARKLGGLLSSYIVLHKIFGVCIKFGQLADLDETSFVAFFEGLFLGGFEFDEYKERKSAFVYKIYLDLPFKSRLELIENAYKTCFVVNQMRYLGQQPANVINPTTLSEA